MSSLSSIQGKLRFLVTLTPSLNAQLRDYAIAQGESIAVIIRCLIKQGLQSSPTSATQAISDPVHADTHKHTVYIRVLLETLLNDKLTEKEKQIHEIVKKLRNDVVEV